MTTYLHSLPRLDRNWIFFVRIAKLKFPHCILATVRFFFIQSMTMIFCDVVSNDMAGHYEKSELLSVLAYVHETIKKIWIAHRLMFFIHHPCAQKSSK